jgi:hypothetical protein
MIVDFRLLIHNEGAIGFPTDNQRSTIIDVLGRRLMVGQVPLEHFV